MIPWKIPTNGRGFFQAFREEGRSSAESGFPSGNPLSEGKPRSVQFGDSALKSLWPFSLVQSTRYSSFITSSRSHFWILVFDIHLTFELWHLKLKIQYFLLAPPFKGANEGHILLAWILYLTVPPVPFLFIPQVLHPDWRDALLASASFSKNRRHHVFSFLIFFNRIGFCVTW